MPLPSNASAGTQPLLQDPVFSAAHENGLPAVSIVIPTYRRESVLVESIRYLLQLQPAAAEILILDQTESHLAPTTQALQDWNDLGKIRWIRLERPSITQAMNRGLVHAAGEVVLFLDDDIIPDGNLVGAHQLAHANRLSDIVAGQVLQPGEEVLHEMPASSHFLFRSNQRAWITELMGGNFSVRKSTAIDLGGFDENFVHVAYRFEAEFCDRATSAGQRILFEPAASIRHLKASAGGTRSYGHHLTTVKPSHAVGAYYYLLRARHADHPYLRMAGRFLRSVRTRHHLKHPWWIPGTLISEFLGLLWAIRLAVSGPALLPAMKAAEHPHD